MRTLSAATLTAQRAASTLPGVQLTIGIVDYSAKLKRIVRHLERPFGGLAVLELDNSDQSITADLTGQKVVIGYGAALAGAAPDVYYAAPPLWVISQKSVPSPGKDIVQLSCIDTWGKIATQQVGGGGVKLTGTIVGAFSPDMRVTYTTGGVVTATGTVSYVGSGFIGLREVTGTFAVSGVVASDADSAVTITVSAVADFGYHLGPDAGWHGEATILAIITSLLDGLVTVELDAGKSDGIIDSADHRPYYQVKEGMPLLQIVQDMLAMTKCGFRISGIDEKLHLFTIASAPETPDYTYGTTHSSQSDLKDVRLILPNTIIVTSIIPTAATIETITGTPAIDTDQVAKFMTVARIVFADIKTTQQGTDMAAAILNRVQKEATQGQIVAPMNCGQELFDYVEEIGYRTYYGWVGSIERSLEPGVYRIVVGLGNLVAGEQFGVDIAALSPYTPPSSYDLTLGGSLANSLTAKSENVTIDANGQITIPSADSCRLLVTSYSGVTDDLDGFAADNYGEGKVLVIYPAFGHTITVRYNSGTAANKILTCDQNSVVLDLWSKDMVLMAIGGYWAEITRPGHLQSHKLADDSALGPDHTITGGVLGYVLRALSATTARFMQLLHSDLTGIGADDHHAQLHHATHEDAGDDEIDLTAMSGTEIRLIPKASSSGAEGTIFYASADNHVYVATE